MGLNVFGNMLMCEPAYFIFLACTSEQPCKLAWNFDLPKSVFHGMTLFVLWHDGFCTAMDKCLKLLSALDTVASVVQSQCDRG